MSCLVVLPKLYYELSTAVYIKMCAWGSEVDFRAVTVLFGITCSGNRGDKGPQVSTIIAVTTWWRSAATSAPRLTPRACKLCCNTIIYWTQHIFFVILRVEQSVVLHHSSSGLFIGVQTPLKYYLELTSGNEQEVMNEVSSGTMGSRYILGQEEVLPGQTNDL